MRDRNTPNLHAAMVAVMAEDAIGKPCVACGTPARNVSVWQPTEECLKRDFGFFDGLPRTAVYPICGRCARKAERSRSFVRRIEDAVIKFLTGRSKGGAR
jgi:hypothetical protein